MDALFCALLNCIKTQLDVVGEALKTIRTRTLKKLNLPPNCVELHDDDCPELERALYMELNRCIKHLILLLKYVYQIFYFYDCFHQFFFSGPETSLKASSPT